MGDWVSGGFLEHAGGEVTCGFQEGDVIHEREGL